MSKTKKTDPLFVKKFREGARDHDHRNGICDLTGKDHPRWEGGRAKIIGECEFDLSDEDDRALGHFEKHRDKVERRRANRAERSKARKVSRKIIASSRESLLDDDLSYQYTIRRGMTGWHH